MSHKHRDVTRTDGSDPKGRASSWSRGATTSTRHSDYPSGNDRLTTRPPDQQAPKGSKLPKQMDSPGLDFDSENMRPFRPKEKYPPIVTIDGRVDTDIDHLMDDDEEDDYTDVLVEVEGEAGMPRRYPQPHMFSVVDGSLDDDVDSLANHDGTMEHTLVDAPKNFNPDDLRDVASRSSKRRAINGRLTQARFSTDLSQNKKSLEHSEEDESKKYIVDDAKRHSSEKSIGSDMSKENSYSHDGPDRGGRDDRSKREESEKPNARTCRESSPELEDENELECDKEALDERKFDEISQQEQRKQRTSSTARPDSTEESVKERNNAKDGSHKCTKVGNSVPHLDYPDHDLHSLSLKDTTDEDILTESLVVDNNTRIPQGASVSETHPPYRVESQQTYPPQGRNKIRPHSDEDSGHDTAQTSLKDEHRDRRLVNTEIQRESTRQNSGEFSRKSQGHMDCAKPYEYDSHKESNRVSNRSLPKANDIRESSRCKVSTGEPQRSIDIKETMHSPSDSDRMDPPISDHLQGKLDEYKSEFMRTEMFSGTSIGRSFRDDEENETDHSQTAMHKVSTAMQSTDSQSDVVEGDTFSKQREHLGDGGLGWRKPSNGSREHATKAVNESMYEEAESENAGRRKATIMASKQKESRNTIHLNNVPRGAVVNEDRPSSRKEKSSHTQNRNLQLPNPTREHTFKTDEPDDFVKGYLESDEEVIEDTDEETIELCQQLKALRSQGKPERVLKAMKKLISELPNRFQSDAKKEAGHEDRDRDSAVDPKSPPSPKRVAGKRSNCKTKEGTPLSKKVTVGTLKSSPRTIKVVGSDMDCRQQVVKHHSEYPYKKRTRDQNHQSPSVTKRSRRHVSASEDGRVRRIVGNDDMAWATSLDLRQEKEADYCPVHVETSGSLTSTESDNKFSAPLCLSDDPDLEVRQYEAPEPNELRPRTSKFKEIGCEGSALLTSKLKRGRSEEPRRKKPVAPEICVSLKNAIRVAQDSMSAAAKVTIALSDVIEATRMSRKSPSFSSSSEEVAGTNLKRLSKTQRSQTCHQIAIFSPERSEESKSPRDRKWNLTPPQLPAEWVRIIEDHIGDAITKPCSPEGSKKRRPTQPQHLSPITNAEAFIKPRNQDVSNYGLPLGVAENIPWFLLSDKSPRQYQDASTVGRRARHWSSENPRSDKSPRAVTYKSGRPQSQDSAKYSSRSRNEEFWEDDDIQVHHKRQITPSQSPEGRPRDARLKKRKPLRRDGRTCSRQEFTAQYLHEDRTHVPVDGKMPILPETDTQSRSWERQQRLPDEKARASRRHSQSNPYDHEPGRLEDQNQEYYKNRVEQSFARGRSLGSEEKTVQGCLENRNPASYNERKRDQYGERKQRGQRNDGRDPEAQHGHPDDRTYLDRLEDRRIQGHRDDRAPTLQQKDQLVRGCLHDSSSQDGLEDTTLQIHHKDRPQHQYHYRKVPNKGNISQRYFKEEENGWSSDILDYHRRNVEDSGDCENPQYSKPIEPRGRLCTELKTESTRDQSSLSHKHKKVSHSNGQPEPQSDQARTSVHAGEEVDIKYPSVARNTFPDDWSFPLSGRHVDSSYNHYFSHVVRGLKVGLPSRDAGRTWADVTSSDDYYIRSKLVGSGVDPNTRDSDYDSIEYNANACDPDLLKKLWLRQWDSGCQVEGKEKSASKNRSADMMRCTRKKTMPPTIYDETPLGNTKTNTSVMGAAARHGTEADVKEWDVMESEDESSSQRDSTQSPSGPRHVGDVSIQECCHRRIYFDIDDHRPNRIYEAGCAKNDEKIGYAHVFEPGVDRAGIVDAHKRGILSGLHNKNNNNNARREPGFRKSSTDESRDDGYDEDGHQAPPPSSATDESGDGHHGRVKADNVDGGGHGVRLPRIAFKNKGKIGGDVGAAVAMSKTNGERTDRRKGGRTGYDFDETVGRVKKKSRNLDLPCTCYEPLLHRERAAGLRFRKLEPLPFGEIMRLPLQPVDSGTHVNIKSKPPRLSNAEEWNRYRVDQAMCKRLAEVRRGRGQVDTGQFRKPRPFSCARAMERVNEQERISQENQRFFERLLGVSKSPYNREEQLENYKQGLYRVVGNSRYPQQALQTHGLKSEGLALKSLKANILAQEQARAIDEYYGCKDTRCKRRFHRARTTSPPVEKPGVASKATARAISPPVKSRYSRDEMERDFQNSYRKMLSMGRYSEEWAKWMPVKLETRSPTKGKQSDRR